MKILRVGDPHVKVSNLEESHKLIDFIIVTALENKVDCIEFLGDLFHTHAVKRLEVEDFWMKSFDKMEKELKSEIRVLVGNHDQPGSKEKEQSMNSLNVFQPVKGSNISRIIINKPMVIGNIAYIPYMSDLESFTKASKDLKKQGAKKLLVCHQTFKGSEYSNGYSTEDGVGTELISQEQIISGHIHKEQQVGKCFYPGTARWDTMSSANLRKGIWLFDHEDDGSVLSKTFISTEKVCVPIKKYVVFEEDGVIPDLKKEERNYLVLHGKTSWLNKMRKKMKGLASIKTVPIDRKINNIEKEKMKTIIDYLNGFFDPSGKVTKKEIKEYLDYIDDLN